MQKLLRTIDPLLLLFFTALILGLAFPNPFSFLVPLVNWFLAAIFFLSSLKINFSLVVQEATRWKILLFFNLVMLILLPLIVYGLSKAIVPSLSIPFLLLAAMPAGMTSPFLVGFIGGKESLGLVLTVTSSLLAPITIPLVIYAAVGTEIAFSFWDMALKIILLIVIPFILAQIVRKIWPKVVKATGKYSQKISMVFLGLLVVGVVANQAKVIISTLFLGGNIFSYLIGIVIFFVILHAISWVIFSRFGRIAQKTATVSFVYMNFTLAIVLANDFFFLPEIVIPVVLSVIPWTLMIGPFRSFIKERSL